MDDKEYREKIDKLTKIQTDPRSTPEEAAEAEKQIDELNRKYLDNAFDGDGS